MNKTECFPVSNSSIATELIDTENFLNLLLSLETYQIVHPGDFIEIDPHYPVINKAAGPCLIEYIYDPLSQRYYSAHFQDVGTEFNLKAFKDRFYFLQEELDRSLSDEEVIAGLTREEVSGLFLHLNSLEYSKYLSYLEWLEINGNKQMEVYLYGNGIFHSTMPSLTLGPQLQTLTRKLIQKVSTFNEHKKTQCKVIDVRDFPYPTTNTIVDTIFMPNQKKVYLCRRG